MFKSFRRAMARVARRATAANIRATTSAMKKLMAPATKPARKKRAPALKAPRVSPAKTNARATGPLPKPRASLGETVRRIKAAGMPARAPSAPAIPAVARGASFVTAIHSSEHGERSYKLYIPARSRSDPGSGERMPLVVMLHGCTQTPDDFATGTGLNALAEEFGFLVAYPAQSTGANANRCWNWFKPSDQRRDSGEPALIAGIARTILRDHGADPQRVYVGGLSAGGAAAAIVASAYPDLFAAVCVHSGLAVGAAHNAASALVAMRRGSPGDRGTVPMPTIIFHGEADTVVHPRNGRFVTARALAALPRLTRVEEKGRSAGGRAFSRTVHKTRNGKSLCEHWAVEGAGHAWSGGHPSGSFSDLAGPDASREMVRFFLDHRTTRGRRRPAGPSTG